MSKEHGLLCKGAAYRAGDPEKNTIWHGWFSLPDLQYVGHWAATAARIYYKSAPNLANHHLAKGPRQLLYDVCSLLITVHYKVL